MTVAQLPEESEVAGMVKHAWETHVADPELPDIMPMLFLHPIGDGEIRIVAHPPTDDIPTPARIGMIAGLLADELGRLPQWLVCCIEAHYVSLRERPSERLSVLVEKGDPRIGTALIVMAATPDGLAYATSYVVEIGDTGAVTYRKQSMEGGEGPMLPALLRAVAR